MDEIYILNSRYAKKDKCGSFIGVKDNELYHLSVDKYIKNNKVHQKLEQSFKYCSLNSREKPIDALFKRGGNYIKASKKDYRLKNLTVKPGNFYPRIYRPFLINNEGLINLNSNNYRIQKLEEIALNTTNYYPYDTKLIVFGLNQLAILTDMLIEILNTVHPSNKTLKTYGHEIKNLIVLSCIEVEAQLKGIFKANEVTSNGNYNYNTYDYIKLKEVMQLHRFSVRLPLYTDLKTFSPFKTWNKDIGPTKSLKWYASYNAVKHNSETEFHQATLGNAILALSAVAILLKAQYGTEIPFWKEEIGSYYDVIDNTKWSIEDRILPPFEGDEWITNKFGL